MNHIALDQQDELVEQFVLSLPINPQGAVLELNGEAVAWVVPASSAISNGNEPWTDAKNGRRCELIDRKYAVGITALEAAERGTCCPPGTDAALSAARGPIASRRSAAVASIALD